MRFGGLQKTSLLDYPGKVSAIIFTSGCNFRCPYCHNPGLVSDIDPKSLIPEKDIFDFLKKKKRVLEAVVITGGEPTLHKDLPEFIRKLKKLDFLIKLDSNGTNPKMLKDLIKNKLIDYIAMDIKSPLSKYSKTVNMNIDEAKIETSIGLIKESGIPYEFRSTILPALHSQKDVVTMSKLVAGAEKYFLQKFLPSGNLNNQKFNKFRSFTDKEMKELVALCSPNVKYCSFR